MDLIDQAVSAIRAGKPVVLPFDTVYGLVATPYSEQPTRRLYRLKQRPETLPAAIAAHDLEMLFECVPELRGRAGTIARALLPGPYTLVLTNPARRYRWLTGTRPDTIGVRVPLLGELASSILARVGAVVATSANLHGGPEPQRLDAVPEAICAGCAALVDGGELPGTPSTVIDFTGLDPRVLREGAAPSAEAIARVCAAVS